MRNLKDLKPIYELLPLYWDGKYEFAYISKTI